MMIKICRYIFFFIILSFFISCKSSDSSVSIVDGQFVKDEQYPTVIKVKTTNKTMCSGVIVSKNVVLTAAHCLFNEEDGSQRDVYVEVDYRIIFAWDYVWLDEYKDLDKKFLENKDSLGRSPDLINKIIGHDIAAVIFLDVYGTPPFEKLINKAKDNGTYFSLSSNEFKDSTFISDNQKDIFFLGFGLSGSSDKVKGSVSDKENFSALDRSYKKQIGYSSFRYDKTRNQWTIPCGDNWDVSKRPSYDMMDILMSDDCVKALTDNFKKSYSYPVPGDSGGPLIYKNQILALASRTGDDIKGIYASLTFGSKDMIAEKFIEKVNNKLSEKDLLENNMIFLTLKNSSQYNSNLDN